MRNEFKSQEEPNEILEAAAREALSQHGSEAAAAEALAQRAQSDPELYWLLTRDLLADCCLALVEEKERRLTGQDRDLDRIERTARDALDALDQFKSAVLKLPKMPRPARDQYPCFNELLDRLTSPPLN